jgi:protein TonB
MRNNFISDENKYVLFSAKMKMKKPVLITCLCLLVNLAFAQKDTTEEYDKEFTTVQVEAQFPGGLPAWKKYLEENLNTALADSCLTIPKGKKSAKQTVIVDFRVDRDGSISEAGAQYAKDLCPLLVAEAIRVIRQGPKWIPAYQNGRKVIYRQRQSITWVLTED